MILGSEGQIGKQVLEEFSKDHTTFAVDIELKLSHDLRKNSFIDEFGSEIEKSDLVVFLAYDVGGARYLSLNQSNYRFLENNVRIMLNVFDFIKKYDKRFIFASSEMAHEIQSPYGVLKALGEDFTEALNGVYARFWNVYDYETNKAKSHVITDFVDQALSYRKIHMLTDGSELRQFLHAKDCARAIKAIYENYDQIKNLPGVDVTSFQTVSIEEIGRIIARKTQSELVFGELGDLTRVSKMTEPRRDILKIWKPEISVEDGIDAVIKEAKSKIN